MQYYAIVKSETVVKWSADDMALINKCVNGTMDSISFEWKHCTVNS